MLLKLRQKQNSKIHAFLIYSTLLLISCYYASASHAQDNTELPQYGVSMHDAPKLKSPDDHLPYTNPNAPKGGTLKQAAIGTFDNLNPFNIKGISARGLNLVYDRLTIRSWDEPFTLYPLIAQNIQFSDNRLNIQIELNPTAKFDDGSAVTSDDILFSFETLKANGRPNMRNIYGLVKDFNIIDPHNIEITLDENANREAAMIIAMMPVLSKDYWENRNFNASLTEAPISNGPYKIKDFEIGRHITYERNPNYWAKDLPIVQGLYNFDNVHFEYYRDDDVALMAFNTGDLNYRREGNVHKWVSGYESQNNKGEDIIKKEILHGRTDRANTLVFNTRRAPFNQLPVRKAIFSLIDFDWINQNIYHDKMNRTITFFPNSRFYATGAATREELALIDGSATYLPMSIGKSTLLTPDLSNTQIMRKHYMQADYQLREAGWIIKDGKRVNAQTNEELTFEILVNNPDDEKIALAFKRGVKRLGIAPTIRRLDSSAFQGRMRDYDFDAAITFWQSSLSPGTEQALYWGCKAADTPAQWNYSGICNPAIETLLSALTNTRTYEDLTLHMRALDRVLTHLHIGIPLLYSNRDYVAHSDTLEMPDEDALYGVIIESWWEKPKN